MGIERDLINNVTSAGALGHDLNKNIPISFTFNFNSESQGLIS